MRLVLAMIVVVSHVPLLRGTTPIGIGDLEIGGWAVAGFFAISGWLVTQSRLHLSLGRYLWRRALRILPAFWTCLVVTAFVAAPISALLGPGSWRVVPAIRYVVLNAGLHISSPKVGNSLAGLPNPNTWNVSLWTLMFEFGCYVALGLLLCWATARRRPMVTVVAFVAVAAVHAGMAELIPGRFNTIAVTFRLASFFLAGSALLRCRRITLNRYGAAATLLALAAAIEVHQVRVLAALPVAYLCLWLGRVLPLQRVGRRNDISYGTYVYAFPVAQLLMRTPAATWPTAGLAALTIVCVIPVAFLSWKLVEQPALRFKSASWPVRRAHPDSPAPQQPAPMTEPADETVAHQFAG